MTPHLVPLLTAGTVLALAVGPMLAQAHGVDIANRCLSPTCVGDPLECLIAIGHNDSFGDTIELSAAYFFIDPAGRGLRDPPEGDLPVALLTGNAIALGRDGGLPVRIGPAGSTLSGLPGADERGEVLFGPGQYIAAPEDPNPLLVKAIVVTVDLCDAPDTEGCFSFPNYVQFTAATLLAGNFDVTVVTDPYARPGAEQIATADITAAPTEVDAIGWIIDGGVITSGQGTDSIAFIAEGPIVTLELAVTDNEGCTVSDTTTLPVGEPDVDGDGMVGPDDLAAVLIGWGDCPDPPVPCPADVDGDGDVDVDDLVFVIRFWGYAA